MTTRIQKEIELLAQRCMKAGVPPLLAVNVFTKAVQNEWQRTLIEAPGLVRTEK